MTYWTWSFDHIVLGEIPDVLIIPADFIIKEPMKSVIANNTTIPDGAISNGYEIIIPATVENTENDIERIIVCLNERLNIIAVTFGITKSAETKSTPTNCIDVTTVIPAIAINK